MEQLVALVIPTKPGWYGGDGAAARLVESILDRGSTRSPHFTLPDCQECSPGDKIELAQQEKAAMISQHTVQVAERAKSIYGQRLQADLEADHPDAYVAIEPESGEHFLADTFGRAVAAARSAHPNRISFVIRVGHPAALHLGGLTE
jgi:hypothetical protein